MYVCAVCMQLCTVTCLVTINLTADTQYRVCGLIETYYLGSWAGGPKVDPEKF